jgi:hypothetical protein
MNRRQHFMPGFIAAGLLLAPALGSAQTFTRITSGNPIVTDPVPASALYAGCAWADYDGDGDQDLYIVQQGLFRNNGATFTKLATVPADHGNAVGCSWADFDNDGDLDLFVSGGPPGGSYLNRNDGAGVFTRIVTGTIGNSADNGGWGCAWGDYDNDGRTDLVIAAPFGFLNVVTPNRVLHNDGMGIFTRVDTSVVSAATGPYTVPSWNDVDDDGDQDLFIAAGPVNGTTAPDFLYENRGSGPGQTFFRRFTTGALATDAHDGQLYNWVDIDSDGDLDCYVTNYGGVSGIANDLYRNTGGVFTRLTAGAAGPIVSDAGHSMASVWGDFDNDGDMDCVVGNDGTELSLYYTNNGSGLFTSVNPSALRALGPHFGAAAADFDADGDLDIYLHGTQTTRGLYRNGSAATNGWLNVRCVGTVSNRAAIGAKVYVRATIGGVSRKLVQLVSAQNSFNGHNPFLLHFGTGNATVAESVIVRFPSGITQTLTNVALRQNLTVVEDAATAVSVSLVSAEAAPERARIVWQLGDPESPLATVYRRTELSGWSRLASAAIDGGGRVSFEDREVTPGTRYAYELGVTESGGERRLGQVWLDIPRAEEVRLEWLGGTPMRDGLRVALTLPGGGDARFTIVDPAGRVTLRRDLTGLAPGRQLLDLGSADRIRPGIYWVRMAHGAIERSVRAVVIR